jgi:Fuc2NAc and GlcNAc transferase
LYIKYASKKRIIDIPNERSSHVEPTPRGGGLAVLISWLIGLSYLFLNNQLNSDLYKGLMSVLILSTVSFIDDIIDLKPWVRLISQLLSTVLALYFIDGLILINLAEQTILRYFINFLLIVAIIWFINLYNFLDGIDGYASIEAISICLGYYLINGSQLAILLIVSVIGFLVWNWPKAKIFMGDVGSTMLGFTLIILAIHFHNTSEFNFIYVFTLSSIFWFDASITLIRRFINRENISTAHKKHAYQRLVQSGYSHRKVISFAIILNCIHILGVYLNHLFLEKTPFLCLIFSVMLNALVYYKIEKIKAFNEKTTQMQ